MLESGKSCSLRTLTPLSIQWTLGESGHWGLGKFTGETWGYSPFTSSHLTGQGFARILRFRYYCGLNNPLNQSGALHKNSWEQLWTDMSLTRSLPEHGSYNSARPGSHWSMMSVSGYGAGLLQRVPSPTNMGPKEHASLRRNLVLFRGHSKNALFLRIGCLYSFSRVSGSQLRWAITWPNSRDRLWFNSPGWGHLLSYQEIRWEEGGGLVLWFVSEMYMTYSFFLASMILNHKKKALLKLAIKVPR